MTLWGDKRDHISEQRDE